MPLTAVKPLYKSMRQAAQTKINQFFMIPPSTQGLDQSQPITAQDPTTALVLTNLLPRRFGNELRAGSKRWKTNLGGLATPSPVITLMGYNPPRGIGSVLIPKLFAACVNGNIYDVTDASNEAFVPPVAVTIPGQINPGQFSHTNFSTAATNYLCICAAGGGYWTYDHAGGWVNRTALIVGPGAAAAPNFDFVMTWKNRLWFIENNTSDAWYLPTNSIQGNASNFDFGPLFVQGGDLTAMASWTVDGGSGIDDKLVVVARGGDCLVYEGTDPSAAATFRIVGRWYVGRAPFGRRFMSKYGGDLAIVTEAGIEYMSRLLQAKGQLDPETQPDDPARRFNEVIGLDVRNTRNQRFWRFIQLASEEAAILLTPHNTKTDGKQYFFNTLSRAWCDLKGFDMACAEEFDGDLFYGTLDGTVCKAFTNNTDDELSDGTPGRTIVGEIQTAFVAPNGDPVSLKTPVLIQPLFSGPAPPQIKAQINTEWDFTPIPGSPTYVANTAALWDSAKWDVGKWSGANNNYFGWLGAQGLGAYFSLRMSVTGVPRIRYTGCKVIYTSGGPM